MGEGKNKAVAIKDPKDLQRVQSYLKQYNYKAYILFMIGLGTGYRGSDLVKLTVKDAAIAIKEYRFTVLEQKKENIYKSRIKMGKLADDVKITKFERVAYINKKLAFLLQDYIRDMDEAEFLYASSKGKGEGKYKQHIRRDSLGKIFKKAAVACGIKDISVGTHTPRKTYGYIQYYKNGKDINFVQELFGHSTSRITKAYIGIDEDMKEASADIMDEFMY